MRKFQKTLNIILAAALAVTSFPATTFAGESVKSSSESVSSASGSSILMNNADEAENTGTNPIFRLHAFWSEQTTRPSWRTIRIISCLRMTVCT